MGSKGKSWLRAAVTLPLIWAVNALQMMKNMNMDMDMNMMMIMMLMVQSVRRKQS